MIDDRYPISAEEAQSFIEESAPGSHTFLNACGRLSRGKLRAMAQAYLRELQRETLSQTADQMSDQAQP